MRSLSSLQLILQARIAEYINLVARACPICSNNPYINSGPNILNSGELIFFFTETVNWTKLQQQKYSVNKLYHISICFFSHVTKFEKNWENEELFFNFAAVIICNFKSVLLQTIPDVIFAYLIFLVMQKVKIRLHLVEINEYTAIDRRIEFYFGRIGNVLS